MDCTTYQKIRLGCVPSNGEDSCSGRAGRVSAARSKVGDTGKPLKVGRGVALKAL